VRVLLDEDVPVQVLESLQQVLHGHTIDHVDRIGWKSKKDLALLPDAGKRGYEVLVTNDKNQLEDVEESRAIRDSGMHHVRYDQDTNRGKEGLALAMASLLAAAVPCIRELEAATGQRLVHIKSIAPHQRSARYDVVDPIKDPPSYWPRGGPAPRRPRRS
jgi:hypothetical protein